MNGLADALASKADQDIDTLDADGVEGDDLRFFNACLEEIDRYRRLDQWIPSYHNILSITGLDCKRKIAKACTSLVNPTEFLPYTRDGCYDALRISAFSNLMELGMGRNSSILRWFLCVLSTDPSPYVREQMLRIFGQTLGSIAIGENIATTNGSATQQDGLIIEQESSTDARQANLARKQTIPGALAAVKVELGENRVLKSALWEAIRSPILTIREIGELLEICSLLYIPETSMLVVLKYPRYVKFISYGKVSYRILTRFTIIINY